MSTKPGTDPSTDFPTAGCLKQSVHPAEREFAIRTLRLVHDRLHQLQITRREGKPLPKPIHTHRSLPCGWRYPVGWGPLRIGLGL
jgi:hypothetical protein